MSDSLGAVGTATVADPCPDEGRLLLEALAAGWLGVDDEPEARPEPWQFTDKALLRELATAQAERARAEGRWLALLAEAERREATFRVLGLPTASWLTERNTHWARSAREEVRFATDLADQPEVAGALASGKLSVEQARVVVTGLRRLPEELDQARRDVVATHLVGLGAEFGPYGLSRLVNRAVEVVAPEVAEEADRKAVEQAEARHDRGRYLTWRKDADGALRFTGRLGKVSGEQLLAVLRALATGRRKAAALAGVAVTRAQAAADALATLVEHYSSCGEAPAYGADRPRVLVTVDYDVLRGALGTATLLSSGEPLSAQQARRLACDASILPVVLDGAGLPLDVGREQRLFTSHLRALLVARDQGCAFPGCDRGPAECEAHHRRPWWDGGRTSLANGVLLCSFHHHLVEPVPGAPPGAGWLIRLDRRGRPEFGAPEGRGAPPGHRRWRQHHRYRT